MSKDSAFAFFRKASCGVVMIAAVISYSHAAIARMASESGEWAPPGMYVSVGTHSLHVHCMGEGSPTVIFEAGLGGTHLDWTLVQPEVARFTRSCSYDRGGYGFSGSGPMPRHANNLSKELESLLLYASLRPPYVLVAHSFGGFPARLYANRNPSKMAGLVLIDSTHERVFERYSSRARKPLAPSGRSFVIANHWEVAASLPNDLKTLAQRLALRPRSVRALYGELADMRRSALQVIERPSLPEVPIHVVTRDRVNAASSNRDAERRWLDVQRDLADRLPNAALHRAAGSGHHVQLDAPKLVVELIRSLAHAHGNAGSCSPPRARPILTGVRGGLGYGGNVARERDDSKLSALQSC